jgi:hypothetical protein
VATVSVLTAAVNAADLSEQAHTATIMVARCAATGLVASSYRGVIAAAVTLGMTGRTRHVAWACDIQFVTALVDLETDLSLRLMQIRELITSYETRLAAELDAEHPNAEAIAALEAALGVLHPARHRVEYAISRLMTAPDELGDTYAAAYNHVRSGRKLPYNGRFLTGAPIAPTRSEVG